MREALEDRDVHVLALVSHDAAKPKFGKLMTCKKLRTEPRRLQRRRTLKEREALRQAGTGTYATAPARTKKLREDGAFAPDTHV